MQETVDQQREVRCEISSNAEDVEKKCTRSRPKAAEYPNLFPPMFVGLLVLHARVELVLKTFDGDGNQRVRRRYRTF